ncbi:transmembrane protein [Planoprotostelium fungivorum]|uniref:Glycerophosphocholine acyltransferase 1 n=1 Tax=Planoprotostelium fungivorum TaxID=1890364 RepID=A0A2P6NGY1_9EUKA|nr:transmembrane protein [Planoprotostelium fungivorum]
MTSIDDKPQLNRRLSQLEKESTVKDWDEVEADDLTFDVLPKSPSVTRIVNRLATDREKIRDYVRKKRSAVKLRLDNPPAMKLRDKLSFTLGVADTILTAFILGNRPNIFLWKYSIQLPLLLLLRFYYYRKAKHHYFLLDFCYFANLILLFYLLNPSYCTIYKVSFSFATGPLLWAIGIWRNSMVFHSLDKTYNDRSELVHMSLNLIRHQVTSLFIHLSPPLVMWTLRWHAYGDYQPCVSQSDETISFYEATILPILPYVIWQALYYVIVQMVRRKKFKADPERVTSFLWMQRDPKSIVNKLMGCFGPRWEIVMFGVLQLAFTVVTMLPVALFYRYYYAHTLFLFAMILWSAWNGSSFYFEVFSKRYQIQLGEYEQEWKALSEALKTPENKKET